MVNQQLFRTILEKLGHSVVLASNGREAVEAVEADTPDLVFMDVQMPVMDGLEATDIIRRELRLTDLPIVAMTAHAMKGDRERFIKAGMSDYVSKPIRMEEVGSVIERQTRDTHKPVVKKTDQAKERDLQVFNEDLALERLGGDREMLTMLRDMILAEAPEMVSNVEKSVSDLDAAGLRQTAHSLKGSMAQLGAERVADLALQLEQMGAEDRLDQSAATLSRLCEEWRLLQDTLAAKVK